MTGIVFGNNASLILFNESDYGIRHTTTTGTGPSAVTTANGHKLLFTTENLKISRQSFDSQTISGNRERMKPVRGNINVSGQIAVEFSPENPLLLLYYAIGTWTTTPTAAGSTGPFTHTFTTGSKLPSFQAEVNFGADAPTGQQYHLFTGLKVNTFSLQVPNNGNITASFDCIGQNALMSDTVLDESPATTAFNRFSSFEANIYLDGSTQPSGIIESFSINVANELDESIYPIKSDGLRAELPNGFQTVTGQFTSFFQSTTIGGTAGLAKAKSGESVTLKLELRRGDGTGSAGNEKVTFEIFNTMLEETSPEVTGPAGVKLQMSFKAYKTTASPNVMTITVLNALANYKSINA